MFHWHTGHNQPGFLPESEVYCHGTDWQAALDALKADMRAYADDDDDREYELLSEVSQDDYPLTEDGSRDYGDDLPSMRATVDAILTDDGPENGKEWQGYVSENDGTVIVFWLSAIDVMGETCDAERDWSL